MDKSAVTNFLQKSMQTLFAGISGAVSSPKDFVPAIAPIPVDDVDNSYASGDLKSYKPEKKLKEKKVEGQEQTPIETVVKEVAQQKNLPYTAEVELAEGGIVKRETIARVGEAGPEAVVPLHKYGKAVEAIYKEGASLLISSSLGFLKGLPPTPAKGSVLAEASRLKSVFGISETPRNNAVVGLKAPLAWWGGKSAKKAGTAAPEKEEKEQEKSGKKMMGNPMRMLKNLKNVGKKGLKFLKGKAGKVGKGIRKVAAGGTKLVKGAKKASMALLKKGSKKIATKLGGKAVAKVGAKALGKGLLKKIPFVGLGAGLLFAGQRLMAGDFKGAALEAMSGAASMIPGAGTAISIGLDATLAAKDMGVLPGQKEAEDQQSAAASPDPSKDMYGRPIILNPSTMKAWKRVVNAAAKDGINLPMGVTSSYRSPEQQQALIDAAQAGDPNAISPAAVGTSPHGQGWAVDIDYYSKANEWMRDKGSKFGFKWQGEGDPVHFDFYNNEPNDKWLRPGKNKWIPNIDPVTTKTKSSGNVKTASGSSGMPTWAKRDERTNDLIDEGMDPNAAAKQALIDFPINVGGGGIGAGGVATPQVIPIPSQPKIVYIPETKKEESKSRNAVIDVFGKGSMEVVS